MRSRLLAACAASIASALTISASPAFAADYPALRGSSSPSLPPPPVIDAAPSTDWNGLYFGAYGASTMANVRRRNPISPWINANIPVPYAGLANGLVATSNRNTTSTSYGVFAGYNVASDDALLGFEADFGWLGSKTNVVSILNGGIATNGFETVQLNTAIAQTRLEQLASVRARAGMIFGNVMPYVTGGFAWGYGSQRDSASLTLTPPVPGVPTSFSTSRNLLYSGYTIGAGIEARFGGLLLRGEYLYTTLESNKGGSNNRVDLNQARLGAGVAF